MSKMDEMKKYIIEFSEDPHTIRLMKIKNGDKFPTTEFKAVKPYTEPDTEKIRKEAYEEGYAEGSKEDYDEAYLKGYNQGLSDAWDAARKIVTMPNRDFINSDILDLDPGESIFTKYTASEAIEKIQQYEQEKEEIKVGNEVKSGDEKYIVLQKYLNNIDELMVVLFNKRDGQIDTWHMYNANGAIFEKTGRHFQEIAEVLRKMKES